MTGYLRFLPMLLWLWFIFFMSSQTGDLLSRPLFPGIDKIAHLIVYGVLGGLVIFSFPEKLRAERPMAVLLTAILGTLLYGISDEYHQSFVMGRSSEVLDVVADVFGALMVGGLWFVIIKQK